MPYQTYCLRYVYIFNARSAKRRIFSIFAPPYGFLSQYAPHQMVHLRYVIYPKFVLRHMALIRNDRSAKFYLFTMYSPLDGVSSKYVTCKILFVVDDV